MKVKVTFEDTFSFAKMQIIRTTDQNTFEKMKKGIGSIVNRKENGINYHWKVIKVESL